MLVSYTWVFQPYFSNMWSPPHTILPHILCWEISPFICRSYCLIVIIRFNGILVFTQRPDCTGIPYAYNMQYVVAFSVQAVMHYFATALVSFALSPWCRYYYFQKKRGLLGERRGRRVFVKKNTREGTAEKRPSVIFRGLYFQHPLQRLAYLARNNMRCRATHLR